MDISELRSAIEQLGRCLGRRADSLSQRVRQTGDVAIDIQRSLRAELHQQRIVLGDISDSVNQCLKDFGSTLQNVEEANTDKSDRTDQDPRWSEILTCASSIVGMMTGVASLVAVSKSHSDPRSLIPDPYSGPPLGAAAYTKTPTPEIPNYQSEISPKVFSMTSYRSDPDDSLRAPQNVTEAGSDIAPTAKRPWLSCLDTSKHSGAWAIAVYQQESSEPSSISSQETPSSPSQTDSGDENIDDGTWPYQFMKYADSDLLDLKELDDLLEASWSSKSSTGLLETILADQVKPTTLPNDFPQRPRAANLLNQTPKAQKYFYNTEFIPANENGHSQGYWGWSYYSRRNCIPRDYNGLWWCCQRCEVAGPYSMLYDSCITCGHPRCPFCRAEKL